MAIANEIVKHHHGTLALTPRDGTGGTCATVDLAAVREMNMTDDRRSRVFVVDDDRPLAILGKTGTGKGLIARAIHAAGPRAGGPFVTINRAAVPEQFLESELFGHTKGAFTGAAGPRKGLLEQASGGTLFLDDIGEMPVALQSKLLDVLERRVVRTLGSDHERPVDARGIAATHKNLRARVGDGR